MIDTVPTATGKKRRDETAEDDQGEEHQDRGRQHLDSAQVVLGSGVELVGGDRSPSGEHAGLSVETILDIGADGRGVVNRGGDPSGDQGRTPIPGKKIRPVRGALDHTDPGDLRELSIGGLDLGTALCARGALGRLDEQHHVGERSNPRRPLHGIVGVRALGRGILKAKRLDRIEDRRSEYGASDRE
jgi:hypothetical protein